uniref:Uncharacterized protein n=1 Tax=Parascaris equorum TaxID=6256 RepID=A0A914SJX3_PAREQ
MISNNAKFARVNDEDRTGATSENTLRTGPAIGIQSFCGGQLS